MINRREKSRIINLRKFHNFVKSMLIEDVSTFTRKETKNSEISLLDLAVGKGGDMFKWLKNDIKYVVGFDIDSESVNGKNGAKDRYDKLVKKLEKNGVEVPNYEYYVCDLSEPSNIPQISSIIKGIKFNIVSCQFAIHYMFKDEKSLNTFIQIVSRNISKGGYFIGTTMDGSKLRNKFENNEIIENNIFRIELLAQNNSPYGNKYSVSLGTGKGEEHYFSDRLSIEYLVDMETLKSVCKKYNLHYVGVVEFSSWYKSFKKRDADIRLSEDEKEFSFMNYSFIFKQIG